MDYQNDINEVIAFINGAILYGVADYNECLSRFTTPINEDYLQERADAIKQAIVTNNELQMAFRRLAVQCNEDSVCESCIVRKYCNSYIKRVFNSGKGRKGIYKEYFSGSWSELWN